MSTRQLILGAAIRLGRQGCEHFLTSLLQTDYGGDLALLVSPDESTEWLTGHGVLCIPIRPDVKDGPAIMRLRYQAYRQTLDTWQDDYDEVMFTDVRDVVFQRDPFDFEIGEGVHCFLESTLHQECPINSMWTERLCSPEIQARLSRETVSCAGTTIGSMAGMRNYLRALQQTIDEMGEPALRMTSDQAAHNVVLYTGDLPTTRHRNFAGPVATLGHAGDSELQFDQAGRLCNQDGSVVHVIHQYDRKPILQSILHARYAEAARPVLGNAAG